MVTSFTLLYIRDTGSLALWVEGSLMFRVTGIQSLVDSYQRLKKWYLIPSCLTLSIRRYVSRVKWSNFCMPHNTYATIHIYVRKHNDDTIMTSGHSSLEKYTSHFIESVVCERELETEQNCNIYTPTFLARTVFLSCSAGLLNRGPGGIASA